MMAGEKRKKTHNTPPSPNTKEKERGEIKIAKNFSELNWKNKKHHYLSLAP